MYPMYSRCAVCSDARNDHNAHGQCPCGGYFERCTADAHQRIVKIRGGSYCPSIRAQATCAVEWIPTVNFNKSRSVAFIKDQLEASLGLRSRINPADKKAAPWGISLDFYSPTKTKLFNVGLIVTVNDGHYSWSQVRYRDDFSPSLVQRIIENA